MKSKQIPLLSFAVGVPDNPCDSFSSTRTISRRRPRLRETLPPALLSSRPPSKQGWMAWNLLDFGWRERTGAVDGGKRSLYFYLLSHLVVVIVMCSGPQTCNLRRCRQNVGSSSSAAKKLQNKQCRSLLRISSLRERKRAPFLIFSLFPRVTSPSRSPHWQWENGGP